MRIGILGAPGTGKSKLARALGKEYDLTVVDGYVQRLQKKTDLALGPWSSYSEHFMVAGERLANEYKVGPDKRITVTTIIDTLAYAAVKSDVTMHQGPEAARATYLVAQAAIQGLTMMFNETWDYDVAFWLPYTDEQIREKSGTWELALDSAYPTMIESFGVPYTFALDGDHASRLKVIREIIELVKNESETPETD